MPVMFICEMSLVPSFVCSRARDIDDRTSRVDFSNLPRDFPTAYLSLQAYVGDERLVVFSAAPKQGQRFFAGGQNVCFKAAFGDCLFHNPLQGVVVLDNEN
jgi:hypothetical protein